MRAQSIRTHLRPYRIVERRATTLNHAFASAIAPAEAYDAERVALAMKALGQDAESALRCVYCNAEAETWDHLEGLVQRAAYSGFGHVLGNLVPCCKPCNSKKGNKPWRVHLAAVAGDDYERRERLIAGYVAQFLPLPQDAAQLTDQCPAEMAALARIRTEVLTLLAQADELAATIRAAATPR